MGTRHLMVASTSLAVIVMPLLGLQGSAVATPGESLVQAAAPSRAGSIATKQATGPKETLTDPTTPQQARANEVCQAVAAAVSGMGGYGGIWVDGAGKTHVAMQHGTAVAVAKALTGRFTGEYVVQEVKFSYNDLAARRDSITAKYATLKTRGLDLLEWGPDEPHNTVWISLTNYSVAKAKLAHTLLGADVIVEQAMTAGGPNDLFSAMAPTGL